jgi:hypothetical protein
MKTRKVVTMDELNRWLTEYVAKHEGCEGTTVTVKYKLRQPGLAGCNWSEDITFSPGKNADKNTLVGIVGNAVREARDTFNVE